VYGEVLAVSDVELPSKIVRPLRSGQITIPVAFREKLGISGDSLLQVTLVDGELRIRPLVPAQTAAGSPWLKELYDRFAAVREEASGSSEGQIDAAIDRAVEAVRRSND